MQSFKEGIKAGCSSYVFLILEYKKVDFHVWNVKMELTQKFSFRFSYLPCFENKFCASINDAGILYMCIQVFVEWWF